MTPHFSVSSSGHLVIQTLKSRVREVSLQTPAVSDIKNTWLSLYPCQSLSQAWTINSYKTTSGKSIKPLVNVQQRFIVRIKKNRGVREGVKDLRRRVNKTIPFILSQVLPLDNKDVIISNSVSHHGQNPIQTVNNVTEINLNCKSAVYCSFVG